MIYSMTTLWCGRKENGYPQQKETELKFNLFVYVYSTASVQYLSLVPLGIQED